MSDGCDLKTHWNEGGSAMRSIGQSAPLSSHFVRYVLGDRDEYLYESMTSIAHVRVARAIAVKVSDGLVFAVVVGVPAWDTCLRRVGTRWTPRGCFMWRRHGRRRGW